TVQTKFGLAGPRERWRRRRSGGGRSSSRGGSRRRDRGGRSGGRGGGWGGGRGGSRGRGQVAAGYVDRHLLRALVQINGLGPGHDVGQRGIHFSGRRSVLNVGQGEHHRGNSRTDVRMEMGRHVGVGRG